MRIRRATIEDLMAIKLQPAQEKSDPRHLFPESFGTEEIQRLCAWTMEEDGVPIACYGLTPCQPGVAEAWALLSEEALKHGRELTEDCREKLDWAEDQFRLQRIQATAREDHIAAHSWLVRLGFVPEGRMRAFGLHGETYWIYGRICSGRG